MPTADQYDPTYLTKYGRVDSATYFRLRYLDQLEEWLTDEKLEYLEDNWPSQEELERNRAAIAEEATEAKKWLRKKIAQKKKISTTNPIDSSLQLKIL